MSLSHVAVGVEYLTRRSCLKVLKRYRFLCRKSDSASIANHSQLAARFPQRFPIDKLQKAL